MVFGLVCHVVGGESRVKFALERFRVRGSNAKQNNGSYVSENRIFDLGAILGNQLSNILVRDRQIQAIFSCLGKNRGKRFGREILKFVDIEIEIFSFILGNIHPAHGRELQLGNEHSTQQGRVILANSTFRKIQEQDFLLIHELSQIDGAFGLSDNVADQCG